MLEAYLLHASLLKRIFEAVRDLITDVNLDCSESGLKLQAMDSSHVALVALSLEERGFSEYRCDRDKALGLNMPAVCKIFKLCGNNDTLRIAHPDESDVVSFIFENAEEDKVSSFNLKLMNVNQDSLCIPEGEQPDVVIRIPSKEFANTCRTLAEFNDTVRIVVDKVGMSFCTTGDVSDGKIVIKRRQGNVIDGDVGVEIQLHADKSIEQSFALKYLNLFAKAATLTEVVQLTMKEDHPIEVRFDIFDKNADQVTKLGDVKFFLAPKMDQVDESME